MAGQEKRSFKLMNEDELSLALIDAQYALRESRGTPQAKSLVILVSGIELAGKGEAVKQLREWVDPRYLQVKADPPHLLTPKLAFWQPYSRFIPAEGQIVVMFGNWYSDLLATAMHVSEPLDQGMYDSYIENMRAFEQDLQNNHVEVVKVWFDLPWKICKSVWTISMLQNCTGTACMGWTGAIKNSMKLYRSYVSVLLMTG